MKNLMDIDFYNDNWDKTSFTLSDYTNIGISIYTNHDEQEYLDADFLSQLCHFSIQETSVFENSTLHINEPITKFYSERSCKFKTLRGEANFDLTDSKWSIMYKIYKKYINII